MPGIHTGIIPEEKMKIVNNVSVVRLALVSLLFILLTGILTFPLVFKFNSYIPGFSSTDEPYGALWHFWWMKYSIANHLDTSDIKMIAAPFGQIMNSGYVYWNSINKLLLQISNPVFAYNIQVLAGFLLAGIITYMLVFFILKDSSAALFSAIIFAFCPYHFTRSWQHLGLSFIQWMPLYILSLLVLQRDRNLKSALFAALSFSLVMAFDLYYAYFMFIVTILFILFDYLYYRNLRDTLRLVKLLAICALFVLAIESLDIYYVAKFIFKTKSSNLTHGVYGYIRPFEDLFSQSARPLSYFLPHSTHPLFGQFTEQFIGTPLYGMSLTEHTLYLGWVPILFALAVFRRVKRTGGTGSFVKLKADRGESLAIPYGLPGTKGHFYLCFLVFLAIASWIFSQPPWWNIFGIKLYMPSFFMYKIAPMFRAYCRFGIVVMLAVAVLAGGGFKFFLESFKNKNSKITITAFFCGLVLFEFWNYPPFKVIDVSRMPAVYSWLKAQQGDFVIAEYPLDTAGANEMYKFYQSDHKKRIINGTTPGTEPNRLAKGISKLSDLRTAGILRWMGVKYVLVHKKDYLESELIEDKQELERISQNTGLVFIRDFPAEECPQVAIMCVQKTGQVDVYEVIAQPIAPELEKK